MDNSNTLSQLLKNSGCDYKIFDLGRKIQAVENDDFSKVELGQMPYPYPMQRQAYLAITYWNEQKQPWIWFLKFPIDERGLLKQSDIGNFIKYVVEAMGTRLLKQIDEETEQKLADNPYTFKPAEDKLAIFHSLIRTTLSMPTSSYYEHAQHYLSGGLGWDKWHTVGLQGVADICTRLHQEQNGVLIRKALSHLPNEPLYAVLGTLEHTKLPEKLSNKLKEITLKLCEEKQPDLFMLSAYVRAMSGAIPEDLNQVLTTILATPGLCHQEVLIGIAGRTWHALEDTTIAQNFLLRLAQTGNQNLFNQIFADLVMLPSLRLVLLPMLHQTPSEELAVALINLQKNTMQGV